jgi:hypothetical protein
MNGRVLTDAAGRCLLPGDMRPGDAADVEIALPVPNDVPPGDYELRFDLVDELVCWFSDLPGNVPFIWRVTID